MAILGHFEASVSINGAAAQEYDDDEDGSGNPNVVSKYIEVVSGENFEVNFKVKKHYNFTCDYFGWNISLDGDQKCEPVIDKSHYSWDHGKSNSRNGVRIKKGDQFSLSKFKFDDLTISDDRNLRNLQESRIKNLGIITIEVFRYKLISITPKGERHAPIDSGAGPVPEKALKGRAVTLAAGLDKPVPTTGNDVYSGKKLDKGPISTFHFKYRSRKSLQDLLIIPGSPTPVPLEERRINELDLEEARELLRKQQSIITSHEEQKRQIKHEETHRSLKRERSASPTISTRSYKVARNDRGIEVVDLADDDDQEVAVVSERPVTGRSRRAAIDVADSE